MLSTLEVRKLTLSWLEVLEKGPFLIILSRISFLRIFSTWKHKEALIFAVSKDKVNLQHRVIKQKFR